MDKVKKANQIERSYLPIIFETDIPEDGSGWNDFDPIMQDEVVKKLKEFLNSASEADIKHCVDKLDEGIRSEILKDLASHSTPFKATVPRESPMLFEVKRTLAKKGENGSNEILTEEDLFTSILSERNNCSPISILGCSYKSTLLFKIARQLERLYPKRNVFYLKMDALAKRLDDTLIFSWEPLAVICLQSFTCETELDRFLLDCKMENGQCIEMELVLEGMEDIDLKYPLIFKFLEIIQTCFKSVRVWLTCPSHLLGKLELLSNHIYTVQPISKDDKARSLVAHWSTQSVSNFSPDASKRLLSFALCCVEEMERQLTPEDEKFVDLTLLCLMLAEIYKKDADCFALDGWLKFQVNPIINLQKRITSISNFYFSFIQKKIQNYLKENGKHKDEDIWSMLNHLTLNIIFPNQVPQLKDFFGPLDPIDIVELRNVGLLLPESTIDKPLFIHQTIADYLFARILPQLVCNKDLTPDHLNWLTDFFPRALLGSIQQADGIYEASYPAITHFFNSIVGKLPKPAWTQLHDFFKMRFVSVSGPSEVILRRKVLHRVASVSIQSSFIHIFDLLITSNRGEELANSVYCEEIFFFLWTLPIWK